MLIDLTSLLDGANDKEITKAFEKFIDHMQEHFTYEESLMKDSSYPMYTIHQAEHYKILNEARYKLMSWGSFKDRDELAEYLKDDFVTWLDQHIKAMDIPMSEFKGIL